MRIEILPLDFMGQGALLQPKDSQLHDLAIDYCKRELAEEVELIRLNKVWVAAEMKAGKPVAIHGITGYLMKPDIPLFRVSGKNASRVTKMLTDRLHAFFADSGARGTEVFIHISSNEAPEQKCHRWQESLKATDATPADRFSITVR